MAAGTGSPRAPSGLKATGKRLWAQVTNGLTFRPDELAILDQACRVADQVAALERVLAKSKSMIPGSTGQQVLHPAIAELRLQRSTLSTLLARLDIPEADGDLSEWDGLTASQRARRAARARWDHRRTA